MRVRLSSAARDYLRQEASYLGSRSKPAAASFLQRITVALGDLATFAGAGFEGEQLPVPGMRRLIRGGYRIDYTVERSEVWVVAISSSVVAPLAAPDDDFDYES